MTEAPPQVLCTPAATGLMETLAARHGPLMFHQSGGCCDGCSPMCYPQGEFLVGDGDVLLATLAETPFYRSRPQLRVPEAHTAYSGCSAGAWRDVSLENPEGVRFLMRSRVFTDEEMTALPAEGRI